MQIQAGQMLDLIDLQKRLIGQVMIERREEDMLFGNFAPGPAFPAVAPLFHEYEEAVNSQALGVVDRLDSAIAALGLHLRSPDGSPLTDVHDVQIWSDGGLSCRMGRHDLPALDHRAEAMPAVQPAKT